MNGVRNKIHLSLVYKKLISALKDSQHFKVEGWKSIVHVKTKKESNVPTLLFNTIDLKLIRRDKGHFILIKRMINQEEITILRIHSPNSGSPNFIKSILELKT